MDNAGAIQDALATAIEKNRYGSNRHGTTAKSSRGGEFSEIKGLSPALSKEVDDLVRMHLHLSERINNEVVHPLQTFLDNDAWKVAKDIEYKIRRWASEMQGHHEMIPKVRLYRFYLV
ncbi:hypothetical protein GGI12_000489 [Dipsacomyces acuminosporus]|nr:hypothetical protein GGI12_000489 [Dipsacomyces acuminosporus]